MDVRQAYNYWLCCQPNDSLSRKLNKITCKYNFAAK